MASNRTDLGKGIFSASAISTIEQCEMKAHYEYELGYETKTISNGLKTGRLRAGMKMSCYFQSSGHISKDTTTHGR